MIPIWKPLAVGSARIEPGRLALIAGPCALEDSGMAEEVAREVKAIAAELLLPFVFKASWRKANRSSARSFAAYVRDAHFDGMYTYDAVRYAPSDFGAVCGSARQLRLLCAAARTELATWFDLDRLHGHCAGHRLCCGWLR